MFVLFFARRFIHNPSLLLRSIASITKLMTAIVVLDSGLDLAENIPYPTPSSKKKLSRLELLYLLLIRSDNHAANSLAEGSGGPSWFVYLMNKKAEELNLFNTRFQDPSGLGAGNKSTAQDLKDLLNYAYNYDIIKNISATGTLSFVETIPGKKSKELILNNTNRLLLQEFNNIRLSKTGTTNAAGKCLVMVVVTESYEKIAIVILGAKNRDQVNKIARVVINRL
ncbi:peptidase S11 [bacterium]|nr:peptidase S11 [bacterium]